MFEPLRFLHVADAHLDLPLQDLGSLSDPVQLIAEEATLTAFDQMIAGAIDQEVDFVLLAGNTFRESDQSLRARLSLVNGLQRLHEHQIDVFVLPGPLDPEIAWRKIPNLPHNVTLLTSSESSEAESATPVAMIREGRVIATITSGTLAQLSAETEESTPAEVPCVGPVPSTNGHLRNTPFRVGLLTAWPSDSRSQISDPGAIINSLSACRCDYLAVPASGHAARTLGWCFEAGQTLNTQDGIAHHPGPLQALASKHAGAHGATLIEVDQEGEIRGTFLPFASVRRLRFEIPIEPATTLEDIRQAMRLQLEKETIQEGEQAWLATWILQGGGESFRSCFDPELLIPLIESLPQAASENPKILIEHQIQLQESSLPYGQDEGTSDLERLYRESLETTVADDPASIQPVIAAVFEDVETLENPHWRERLLPLVTDLDPQRIFANARALGNEWFCNSSDEE